MSLQNPQYDAIMRQYDKKQLNNRHSLEERTREILEKFPRIEEIQQEIAALSARKARALLSGETEDLLDLREDIAALSREKKSILSSNGYAENYLELQYECPLCQDTGYIDGEKCSCFQNAALQMLYDQSNIREILQKENFQTFSFDYYSDTIIDEETGKTPLEHARAAVQKSMDFIDHFQETADNLFLFGDTGVGKTFLSHCIARELIQKGYSVLYFSAYELFQILADSTFSRDVSSAITRDSILTADLLIIDDLGTELTNSFVSSQLFLIINERLATKKPAIISTNYDLKTFSDVYSTRTFSRIMQSYTMINLIGKDIRVQKTIGGSEK